MKILYFTGTGNCRAAAKRIGAGEGAELLSIPQLAKEGRYGTPTPRRSASSSPCTASRRRYW